MPYTPPSHRSPASSASTSPNASRRPSLQSGSRPSLPRSASYLSKHRRTPSVATVDGSAGSLTPQGTSDDLPALAAGAVHHNNGGVRQSPYPWADDRGMPKGAVISPPDSASSGSDDETTPEIRGRKLDKLKDLRDAVSQIPHARTPSPPSHAPSNGDEHLGPHRNGVPSRNMHISFSTSALGDLHNPSRKIGHVRSATEPNAPVPQSADNSITGSEEDTDEDLKNKPQMVRKKSGELVRPALRPSSRRRPSSMPGTPVFSKAVHFDSHLEHVRHFLQVDRPLAVSAGSSPVDSYESDTEYPFPNEKRPVTRTPPFEWEIVTPNFPHDSSLARNMLPVKLERVWLSTDQKTLHGSVAVANLAFQKLITCRFTLDYWKTTSEVVADFSHEIRPQDTPVAYDRFNFSIKLSETGDLTSKTLYLCLRYSVNGQEFWDNNGNANFQVDFRQKHLPQNGKNNFQGAGGRPRNSLPRSNRRQNGSSGLRPKSMPVSLQEFDNGPRFKADEHIHDYLAEPAATGLRLKSKSSSNIASDNIAKGLSSPSGVAFANRYDFGASLSAAVQAAKDSMGKDKDALYMKENLRGSRYLPNSGLDNSSAMLFSPTAIPAGADSPTPSLPSASYEELVNKYCFFGTKPSAPFKGDRAKNTRSNGAPDQNVGPLNNTAAFAPRQGPFAHGQTNLGLGQDSNSPSPTESPSPNYLPVTADRVTRPQKAGPPPGTSAADFVPVGATKTHEGSYSSHQHVLPGRFPWGGDAPTTPAIRG